MFHFLKIEKQTGGVNVSGKYVNEFSFPITILSG